MGVCDDILKKDIVPSCDDPVVQGLEQIGRASCRERV